MFKQKDATYNAIVEVTGFDGSGKCSPTKEQRAVIIETLVGQFNAGQIELSSPQEDMKEYVSGLVSNWLRKDTRLNGGSKYVPSNPGSRTSDPTLKAMNALLATLTDPMDRAVVEAEIAAHKAATAKSKAPVINFDALPESLRAKFSA
jgi:hypothetical protein